MLSFFIVFIWHATKFNYAAFDNKIPRIYQFNKRLLSSLKIHYTEHTILSIRNHPGVKDP